MAARRSPTLPVQQRGSGRAEEREKEKEKKRPSPGAPCGRPLEPAEGGRQLGAALGALLLLLPPLPCGSLIATHSPRGVRSRPKMAARGRLFLFPLLLPPPSPPSPPPRRAPRARPAQRAPPRIDSSPGQSRGAQPSRPTPPTQPRSSPCSSPRPYLRACARPRPASGSGRGAPPAPLSAPQRSPWGGRAVVPHGAAAARCEGRAPKAPAGCARLCPGRLCS